MSEPITESPAAPEETAPQQSAEGGPGEPDWKAKAREWEKRANADAKARQQVERERDELKQQHMTAAEKELAKARDEARKEGHQAALTEFGRKLVEAEARAALSGRREEKEADELIADLNVANFVAEDGSPDRSRLKAWADRVAPAQAGPPSLGQGVRAPAASKDMNSLIRQRAGF